MPILTLRPLVSCLALFRLALLLKQWVSMPTMSTPRELLPPVNSHHNSNSNRLDSKSHPNSAKVFSQITASRTHHRISSSPRRETQISADSQLQLTHLPESIRTSLSRGRVARATCREKSVSAQAGALLLTLSVQLKETM